MVSGVKNIGIVWSLWQSNSHNCYSRWPPKTQTIELRGWCRTKLETFRPRGGNIYCHRSGQQDQSMHLLEFGRKRSDWKGEICHSQSYCTVQRRNCLSQSRISQEYRSSEKKICWNLRPWYWHCQQIIRKKHQTLEPSQRSWNHGRGPWCRQRFIKERFQTWYWKLQNLWKPCTKQKLCPASSLQKAQSSRKNTRR